MNVAQGKMIVEALPSLYPLQRYEEEAIKAVIGAISSNHENDVPDTNVGELISKQAAVEVVQNRHMMLSKEKVLLINDIEKLPSAEPKRIRGKWIYHIDDLFPAESTMECNQCHAEQPLICDDEFCPKCGAKMEATE